MTPLWTLLAVFVAGTVKGIAGLGFPTLATPLLSLAVDVKTAVALLILPNIVMDGIQFARRGAPTETIRRLLPLLIGGAVGTIVGPPPLRGAPPPPARPARRRLLRALRAP